MRTIETTLWPLEEPADQVGAGVFLGEERAPDLVDLQEGERVILIELNELRAIATVHRLTLDGRTVWFGEIGDRESIEVIYPDPARVSTPSDRPYDDHVQDAQ
jgi:hypothetical protein